MRLSLNALEEMLDKKELEIFSQAEAYLDLWCKSKKTDKFLTSERKLGNRWGWGRIRTRNFLSELEKLGVIKAEPSTEGTIITFLQSEEPQEKQPKKAKPRKRNDYTEDFERFWLVYPRRIEKARAFKSWNARLKEGHQPEEMIGAAENYSRAKKGTEMQYIKHPSTFLGADKPFKDYSDVVPPAKVKHLPPDNPGSKPMTVSERNRLIEQAYQEEGGLLDEPI